MTAMEALNAVENGISREMQKCSAGHSPEYWQDSTRNGLALASEIVNAVKLKAAIQLAHLSDGRKYTTEQGAENEHERSGEN
jgi:hypothetical protein